MSSLALRSLTNSQVSARPEAPHHQHGWARLWAKIGLWRARVHQRRELAELTARELADFGATTADVYRELNSPFWRSLPPKY